MLRIRPRAGVALRPSLLPPAYRIGNAAAAFAGLVAELLARPAAR
jgi:hypothetical protein